MILIYIHKNTPRLKYIFDLIFKHVLGVSYRLTENAGELAAHQGPVLSYADHPVGNELFFCTTRLLFEKGIENQRVHVFDWEGTKAFFATQRKLRFPFDPFAASFYLVSRYEEYLPHIRDQYDRFNATESLAYQEGFLQKPLVNIWAQKIREAILEKFPGYPFPERHYKFVPTIDIDNAYAYLEKGFMRTAGAYMRSLITLNFADIIERTKVMLGISKDPYDTYDYLLAIQKKFNTKPVYFFLVGDYGENDKNVSPDRRRFQSLIKSTADYAEVGVHPSFGSNQDSEKMKKEVAKLSRILKREVTKSRQHFLKLHFPVTYRRLIDLDITDDYTMGYASDPGFRASICTPFYFYDLDSEVTTTLRVHSFCIMESTLYYYLKSSPEQAMNIIVPLVDEVKQAEGVFMSLWHNESLSGTGQWKGWKEVYEQMVKYAAS